MHAGRWVPDGWTPPEEVQDGSHIRTARSIGPERAVRTPQFPLFWVSVFGNAVAGVSVISCAKTLMNDTFGTALPAVVGGGFAASYVAALSAANMLGRLGWASASDWLGRKNTYTLFGVGIPLCIGIPYLTSWVANNPSVMPLILFYGSTWVIVSFYGGVFSVLPAYLADVFGQVRVAMQRPRLFVSVLSHYVVALHRNMSARFMDAH